MSLSPPPSPALARVLRGDTCAGCGACAAVASDAVQMSMVPPGFLRPQVHGEISATADARIARVCPGLGQTVSAKGRTDDVLWGPYIEMQTGWASDAGLRHAGASGGGVSALVAFLMASGKVDAAITVTPDDQVAVANKITVVQSLEGIEATAGSRYAPSAPLADLPARLAEHRATGRRFVFVGKPCDAAALRALQAEETELQRAIPYVLSFFCAGVPSQKGAEAVLAALGTSPEAVSAFRYRGNGWPGRATATRTDGSQVSMSYHDSWGKILSKHVQHRCKICADGTGVAADIACADAWEADEAGYPIFQEADGTSLFVTRTQKGVALLAEAAAAGAIETSAFEVQSLTAIQPGQRERRRALAARLLALRLMRIPVPAYEGLSLRAAARQNPLRRNLKNFLGTLRRAIKARMSRAAPF